MLGWGKKYHIYLTEGTMRSYLVAGSFFEWQEAIDLEHSINTGELWARAALTSSLYVGVICDDPDITESGVPILVGNMADEYGESKISDITLTDTEFKFSKKYAGRKDTIFYTFQKDGEKWVGEYSGTNVGKGLSRCVLTLIPDDFFDPRSISEALGKPEYLKPTSFGDNWVKDPGLN